MGNWTPESNNLGEVVQETVNGFYSIKHLLVKLEF